MCRSFLLLLSLLLLKSVFTQNEYNLYFTEIGINMGLRRHYVSSSASSRLDCGGQCKEDHCCNAFEYQKDASDDNCLLSYENVNVRDLLIARDSVTYASTSRSTQECSFEATIEPVSHSP